MLYKNELSSLFKFKWEAPLALTAQGKLNSSHTPKKKSLHTVGEQEDFNCSNFSEEFIK